MQEQTKWRDEPINPVPDEVLTRGGVHGLTKREYTLIEMMKGLLANNDIVQYGIPVLFKEALTTTKLLEEQFEEERAE